MSYIEDAIYTFLKRILTRGIIVLTNKRFLLYTSIAIILPILLTITSFITGSEAATAYQIFFKLELAVCVALAITGLISLRIGLQKIEHLFFVITSIVLFGFSLTTTDVVGVVENTVVLISFYSWIITTNIAGLTAIREFMVSWPGWLIRLGDKEDRITFSPVIKIAVFISLLWFAYSIWTNFSWSLLMAFFAGTVVFYTIYVFLPFTKDSIMTSILSFFYFTLLYHLFVRAETSTGFLIVDIILIVASTIFTAASISNLIASKKYALPKQWDSLIILLLGFMLGYHLLGVRIIIVGGLGSLYSLYHDISFGFGTLIMFGTLLLYMSNKKFREFSKGKITLGYALKKASTAGLDAIGKYAKGLKDTLKDKEWQIEFKKQKDDDTLFDEEL